MKENSIAPQQTLARRLTIGFVAGVLALVVNTALLQAASMAGIETGRGGLLRLTEMLLERLVHFVSSAKPGSHVSVLPVSAHWFLTFFRIATGLFMAELYACVLEPKLPKGIWKQGLIFGTAVWLFNSFVVLPSTGGGIAGSRHLGLPGILCFAVAHIAFFISLALIFHYLARRKSSE